MRVNEKKEVKNGCFEDKISILSEVSSIKNGSYSWVIFLNIIYP